MEAGAPARFGELLRRYRRAAGLSQEALAERARLSVRAVSALELGVNRAPRFDTLRLLGEALGLAPGERAALAAAAWPGPTVRHNLPAPLTSFVGRSQELAAVRERLLRADVRLLALTGPGGVGKSRLALQAAAALLGDFPDGITLVPLAPLGDPGLVLPTIGHALGLRETPGRPMRDALVEHLADRSLLLVLDNFEHVVAAAPAVTALLAGCLRVKVLVTTRAVLHVYGEHEYPVPPLRRPDPAQLPPLAELQAFDAVRLFVERAEAAQPGFALTAESAPAVAALCHRLDGLPLAIELAAARTPLLPPVALLARLERRLPLLTGGAHDLPARQRTLRATVDWSHDLLTPAEQVLFRRLGLFAGGFTLAAAAALAAVPGPGAGAGPRAPAAARPPPPSPEDELEVLERLQGLLDQSLVLQGAAAPGGPEDEPRYSLLETIREFALERLEAGGEEGAVRREHAVHFLALAERAESELEGVQQKAWLDRLEAERFNLRAALDWMLEQGERTAGLRLCATLYRFWVLRDHGAEGRSWLARFLDVPDGAPPTELRVKALAVAGNLAWHGADLDAARTLLKQSLALGAEAVERLTTASPLLTLGLIARSLGNYARARVLAEERLRLARASGDAERAASSLWLLGSVLLRQGHTAAAGPVLEEALVRAREAGDVLAVAQVLLLHGELASYRGDEAGARTRFEESLAAYRGLSAGVEAHLRLGRAVCLEGDLIRARTLLEEGLSQSLKAGAREQVAWSHAALGDLARAEGDLPLAGAHFRESLAIAGPLLRKPVVAPALEGLSRVATAQGQPAVAGRLLAAAAAIREATGDTRYRADQAAYEDALGGLRASLGDGTFDAVWAEGRRMTLQQAVAYAQAAEGAAGVPGGNGGPVLSDRGTGPRRRTSGRRSRPRSARRRRAPRPAG